MKKLFKDEKDSHFIAGLVLVASGVVIVFTFLFNTYSQAEDCPIDRPVDYPCVVNLPPPEITYSTEPINDYGNTAPVSAKYSEYAKNHVWATTTPVTRWEKNDLPYFLNSRMSSFQKCFVASTSIYLSTTELINLSFNYALCPDNSPIFYPATESTVFYYKSHSEHEREFDGSPAFRVWFLGKDETPENFIKNLIKTYPDALERQYCKLDSPEITKMRSPKGNLQYYSISPSDTYKKMLADKGEEWMGSCYPYSNYFQLVGRVLVYISNSQDVSLFDPDSMTISDVKVEKGGTSPY